MTPPRPPNPRLRWVFARRLGKSTREPGPSAPCIMSRPNRRRVGLSVCWRSTNARSRRVNTGSHGMPARLRPASVGCWPCFSRRSSTPSSASSRPTLAAPRRHFASSRRRLTSTRPPTPPAAHRSPRPRRLGRPCSPSASSWRRRPSDGFKPRRPVRRGPAWPGPRGPPSPTPTTQPGRGPRRPPRRPPRPRSRHPRASLTSMSPGAAV
mmetsp:Transcript_54931/g.114943  ORF Transcript_54931/g.114943 Transcript_54931/m.114943 type:complete len:209 (-) Transcript_54931:239-865(-)